jgi:azurin
MRLTRRAAATILTMLPIVRALPAEKPVIELQIATDGDELRFVPRRLICPSGATVRVFLHHAGEIINDVHNWVLLRPGTKNRLIDDADREPDETLIVPPGDEYLVLAATPLCGRRQTVVAEFTAPASGEYPFVCSIPGHGATMAGVLIVTA